jgi:hypothetical protein
LFREELKRTLRSGKKVVIDGLVEDVVDRALISDLIIGLEDVMDVFFGVLLLLLTAVSMLFKSMRSLLHFSLFSLRARGLSVSATRPPRLFWWLLMK